MQEILAYRCRELAGPGVIENAVHIVDFREERDVATGAVTVVAMAEDGREYSGDMLVGADGIYSKVCVPRRKAGGETRAVAVGE